jgi:hypothetical protein
MMGICAPFYKRITGEQVRCREAKGQAAKVTVVLGPTNNLDFEMGGMSTFGGKADISRTFPQMSAFDPKATSADTINFPRRGKHKAAGVSLDTRLGSAT